MPVQQSDCLLCHAKPKRTPLDLSKNAQVTFRLLLEGDYFEADTAYRQAVNTRYNLLEVIEHGSSRIDFGN